MTGVAAVPQQLVMRALFGDAASFEDQDPVGVLDRGQAVRNHQGGPAAADVAQRGLDLRPAATSTLDVASSRIRTGASFSSARAMAMRCRCPPEHRLHPFVRCLARRPGT